MNVIISREFIPTLNALQKLPHRLPCGAMEVCCKATISRNACSPSPPAQRCCRFAAQNSILNADSLLPFGEG